jgi:hypothetical protein
MNAFVDAMKWVFLSLVLLVPFGVGFVTTKFATGGWIAFGLCAMALTLFAFLGEGARQSTHSTGLDAHWAWLPILCLIAGRLVGTYSAS